MLHSLSENIADFLLSKKCFDEESKCVYVYGTELILSSLIGILTVLILSIIFNCFVKGLLFYISFYTLRSYAGGLHCNTHLKCNLTFIAVFLICIFSDKFLQAFKYSSIVIISMIIVSAVIIAFLAPVENIHKPIDKIHRKKFKFVSLGIYTLHIALYFVLSFIFNIGEEMIIITDFLVAISMIIGMFSNMRRCNNESCKDCS